MQFHAFHILHTKINMIGSIRCSIKSRCSLLHTARYHVVTLERSVGCRALSPELSTTPRGETTANGAAQGLLATKNLGPEACWRNWSRDPRSGIGGVSNWPGVTGQVLVGFWGHTPTCSKFGARLVAPILLHLPVPSIEERVSWCSKTPFQGAPL